MKGIIIGSFLITTMSAWAGCSDLSGHYRVSDIKMDCKVEQSDGTLMVYPEYPSVQFMSKPGENYGYLLNGLVINGLDQIQIKQNGCESLTVQGLSDSPSILLFEVGRFPYFGARSPVFVDINIDESGLQQTMPITKYTVVTNGQQVIHTDLKYLSSMTLNEKGDLVAKASIRYGKRHKKIEAVECKFTRL